MTDMLNLCDGVSDQEIHVGTPKPAPASTDSGNNEEKAAPEDKFKETTTAPPSSVTVAAVRVVDVQTRKQHAFVSSNTWTSLSYHWWRQHTLS